MALLIVPGAQGMHVLVPGSGACLPLGHSMHKVCPPAGWLDPTGQPVHVVAATEDENLPTCVRLGSGLVVVKSLV